MLQVFYLDDCNGFQLFLQVFQIHVSSVSFVFFYVDQVLHMVCVWEVGGGTSSPIAGDVQVAWAPAWMHVMQVRSSEVQTAWAHIVIARNGGKTDCTTERLGASGADQLD